MTTTSRGLECRAFGHKIPNAEVRRQVSALVASGQLSVPQAAERYGISTATLQRYVAEFGGDQ
ncbi:helix-turn-helix domain-containing protein [Mycobacteroides abscessus subsp. bolletii]|uniref:helix-turn-helix domain-containing protein n=1 Tax=Mycobacteroides abscessus TaxID=36809 RepID=UPI0019D197D1|nr:helix-turn-helix domain-containing protein [Mycobacteroides abscessus]MBN7300453.1 helix-turn-helix domain-containing protein [Mycobacteroides abscessus subsp. bolletii]